VEILVFLKLTGAGISTWTNWISRVNIIGGVLIGVSTSLPELSTIAAVLRMGKYEMAIGEVLERTP
jgi:cation:H+ antiporter